MPSMFWINMPEYNSDGICFEEKQHTGTSARTLHYIAIEENMHKRKINELTILFVVV
jgi:hypothetical protein